MNGPTAVEIIYPESDGAPLGENTVQVDWIIALFNGFQALFRHRDDVFLAADLFWYPVLGEPKIVTAPDVMIAFDRPKGDRRSYKQWEEGDVAPQVVIEVLSPSNTPRNRATILKFYQQHGVEEFYEYDPDGDELNVWLRQGNLLVPVEVPATGFLSPRLGVRFEAPGGVPLRVVRPDGEPFRTYLEMVDDFESEHEAREFERARADLERKKAQEQKRIAERERQAAEGQRARADALAAKLRELGIDPDTI